MMRKEGSTLFLIYLKVDLTLLFDHRLHIRFQGCNSWARISLVTLDRDHVTSPPTLGTVKALVYPHPTPSAPLPRPCGCGRAGGGRPLPGTQQRPLGVNSAH